nr:GNAT family N-acetyltransferase [Planosporangium thailandense]
MRAAYERAVARPDRTALCAESGGGVVGFAALGPPFEPVEDADPGSVAQLFGLYVVPERWDRRIGSSLHDESVRRWRQAGVVTARLEVWERNERARAFYLRRGWRPDGHERPGPGGYPYLRMVLSLS